MGCEAGDIGHTIHPHPDPERIGRHGAEVFEGSITDLYIPKKKYSSRQRGEAMINEIGMFVLGLFLLLLGGDSLVRGVSGLGQRLGLSPFAAGLLLVSFATSMPELAVNMYAFHHGQTDLALGRRGSAATSSTSALPWDWRRWWRPLLVTMRLLAAPVVFVLVATGHRADVRTRRLHRALGKAVCVACGLIGFCAFVALRGRTQESAAVQTGAVHLRREPSTGLVQNLVRFVFAAALFVLRHAAWWCRTRR
jgi:cation:H+ antiporter